MPEMNPERLPCWPRRAFSLDRMMCKRPRQGPQFGQVARDTIARLAISRVSPWTQPLLTCA